MLRLIETIKHPTSRSDIKLPEFDTEKPDTDACAWCNTVNLCFGENLPQGGPLIIAQDTIVLKRLQLPRLICKIAGQKKTSVYQHTQQD
ncbi:unnamed protein product [Euphydryas editha]|uniref:Uncharacterized protein n=1 Tax=Euphydryas editha TaxID=104508 RepID=A0AAU9UUS9_EUPED|nr:unnamed protein product [Euphydryas editha]